MNSFSLTTFANGNRLTRINQSNQLVTYAWDKENRMATFTNASNQATSYSYDGEGKLRQRVEAAETRKLLWDGQNISRETDNAGAEQVAYTLEPAGMGNLVSQRQSNASKQYHHDALGSSRDLTDSNQAVSDTRDYKAFGPTNAQSGSTANRFWFVGRQGYWTDPIGHLLLRARWYDQEEGVFINRDPAQAEINLYRYVLNRPTLLIDPSGLVCQHGPGCQHHGGCQGGGGTGVTGSGVTRPGGPTGPGMGGDGGGGGGSSGATGGELQWPCPTTPSLSHNPIQSICCPFAGKYCGICANMPLLFQGCQTITSGQVGGVGQCKGQFRVPPTGWITERPGLIVSSCGVSGDECSNRKCISSVLGCGYPKCSINEIRQQISAICNAYCATLELLESAGNPPAEGGDSAIPAAAYTDCQDVERCTTKAITRCNFDLWFHQPSCIRLCSLEHEQTHRYQCCKRGETGYYELYSSNPWNLEEAAYERTVKCLGRLANQINASCVCLE